VQYPGEALYSVLPVSISKFLFLLSLCRHWCIGIGPAAYFESVPGNCADPKSVKVAAIHSHSTSLTITLNPKLKITPITLNRRNFLVHFRYMRPGIRQWFTSLFSRALCCLSCCCGDGWIRLFRSNLDQSGCTVYLPSSCV